MKTLKYIITGLFFVIPITLGITFGYQEKIGNPPISILNNDPTTTSIIQSSLFGGALGVATDIGLLVVLIIVTRVWEAMSCRQDQKA